MGNRSNDLAMAEIYKADPALAMSVMNDIMLDGDQAELMVALRHMALDFGGISAIAEKANLNPTQMYRTLSAEGNPTFSNLRATLGAMNLQLMVQPIPTKSTVQNRSALRRRNNQQLEAA
jgi:probable addiction module antidote protein